jgi:hypothetical protein
MAEEIDPEQKLNDDMMLLIKRKVKAHNPARREELLEQKINVAYLCGHQNLLRDQNTGALVPTPENSEFYIPVKANKLLPGVINDIAVATKSSPKYDIVPSGTDEDDKATATACEKIMPHIQRVNDANLHRKGVVLWYDISGYGWRKVYWNPYYKVTGQNPMPGEEGHNPNMAVAAPIFQGEVIIELIPNNEVIFDRRIKDIRRLKWIIHHKSITISEAKERFGEEIIAELPEGAIRDRNENKESFEINLEKEFATLSSDVAAYTTAPEESKLLKNDKCVDYYEFWHVIDKTMPQGAFAVGLGDLDKLVTAKNEPYPIEQYPHQGLPIIGASPISLEGISIKSVPRLTQARPLQREYNLLRSKILDTVDAMGNAVMFAPQNSNLNYKKIDNVNANVIEYEGAFKPTREAGVPPPNGIFAHLETVRKDIDEIFSFHEPSKGIMPEGGPRSAIGLQTLQEADATQLHPMIIGLDESDERVIYQALSLALANYGDRAIPIIGKDNRWTLDQVNTQELNDKINVIVRTGSSLPMNKTLEQEKTVFSWQSGLLGNPQDPDIRMMVLKTMDLGSFDQILQQHNKQENFAKSEFIQAEKLALQMPPVPIEDFEKAAEQFIFVPPVNSFDDHYVHQKEHANFILDKYYDYLSPDSPPQLEVLIQAMIEHNNQHGMAIQQAQMMALQNEMLLKGVTLEQKGQTIEQIKAKKPDKTPSK